MYWYEIEHYRHNKEQKLRNKTLALPPQRLAYLCEKKSNWRYAPCFRAPGRCRAQVPSFPWLEDPQRELRDRPSSSGESCRQSARTPPAPPPAPRTRSPTDAPRHCPGPTKNHEQGSEDLRRHRDAKTLEKPSPSGEGERRNERDGGSYVEAEALDVGVDGDALLLRRRLHLLDPHRRYRPPPPPPPISTRCVSRASLPPQQFREGREKWWGLLGAWAQNKSAGRQDSLGFRSFHLSEKYVNLH